MPIVKRYKTHVPVDIRDWEQITAKVFLDPKTGFFEIDLPENVCDVVRNLTLPDHMDIRDQYMRPKATKRNLVPNQVMTGRRVVGKSLDAVMDAFKLVCLRYSQWMQDNVAEKYLQVRFGANVRHVKGFHDVEDAPRSRQTGFHEYTGGVGFSMSFATCPAVEMSFKTVWKIEDNFYTKHPSGRWHAVTMRDADKTHHLKWSQEREDFLAKMDHAITGMICQMIVFFEDLEGNMSTAIEGGLNPLQIAVTSDEN